MKKRLVELAIGFGVMALAGWLFGATGAIIVLLAMVLLLII